MTPTALKPHHHPQIAKYHHHQHHNHRTLNSSHTKPSQHYQKTIIITKKRMLQIHPQHATLTLPSATSTPEPNIQCKKPRYSDILPYNARLLLILALHWLIASLHFSSATPISIYNRRFKKNLSILISTLLTVVAYLTIVHDLIHIRGKLNINRSILEKS